MLRTSCESGGRAERVPGVTKFSSICRLHCAVGLKTDAPRCYPEHLSATNQNDGVNAAGPCARDLNDARERMREVLSGKMLTIEDVTLGASFCDCIVSEDCTAATACPPFAQALIAEL